MGAGIRCENPTLLCWHKVFFNLLAFVPFWRPFDSTAVCSHCCTPSGDVPGGVAVDCSWKIQQDLGGDGARRRHGLDLISFSCSGVFGVKFQGQNVIFFFSVPLYVICTPPTME
jgi:hypothetical protein